MFSALRQNSVLYILDQNNGFELKIGQVSSVSSPKYVGINQYVDVVVTIGNEQLELKQLPANLSIATKDKIIVSESQEAMFNEVQGIVTSSEQIISKENISYHQSIVDAGKPMLSKLSPKYAKQQELEDKLSNLEDKVTFIDSSLGDIKSMLAKALNK